MPLLKGSIARKALLTLFLLAAIFLGGLVLVSKRELSAWDKAQAELFAKGERLNWEELIPPQVTPEENYFEHPIVREWLQRKGQKRKTLIPAEAQAGHGRSNVASVAARQFAGQEPFTLASMDYLKQLPRTEAEKGTNGFTLEELSVWYAQWDGILAAFREAALRPHVILPGDYTDPITCPTPDFLSARGLGQLIVSRARTHLLLGKPSQALEDLESLRALMRGLESAPHLLVSAMVHTLLTGFYADIVSEGIMENHWSNAELGALRERLGSFDELRRVQRAIREGERAGIGRFFEQMVQSREQRGNSLAFKVMGNGPPAADELLMRLAPEAWIRRNQAAHALLLQEFIESIDEPGRRFYPQKVELASARAEKMFSGWSPETMIATILTPNFKKGLSRAARTQAFADMTLIACELELFRRQHGEYPANLLALSPTSSAPLPRDVASGAEYKYRREGASFALYSLGLNEKDDGGKHGDSWDWKQAEDWVWGKAIANP